MMHKIIIDPEEDERRRNERYLMMTQTPVRQLVLKMSGPTVISMLVTAFYNIIDAVYVGHLSTEATAGVGVAFAYMTFIQAFGFFFGHGSGNYISQALGARQFKDAEKMSATGFVSPLIFGSIAGIIGLIFISPLSRMMGATPEIVPYTNDYLRFILIGTPFMMSSLVLNNQLRLQGNARFAMVGIASGAVLNIILDPIFIFVLDWGVTGASVATCISQIVGWALLLIGSFREGNVHVKLRNFNPTWRRYKQIFEGGFPSLCRQTLACVATICLNHSAAIYAAPGLEASTIGAFSIVSRVMMFAFSIILGLGQGFQPVCGFNYGAKLYGRVRDSYLFTIKAMTILLTIMALIGFIFAPDIIRLFRSEDSELISVGSRVLRWQCVAFPLVGLTTATNMLFQNLRMTLKATLLSMGRQGLFFLPTIFIAPLLLGLTGVEITQAVADVMTFIMALPFAIGILRELKK